MPNNSILVIHLAGIGDLLMGRLALERLRQTYPHGEIVLLTWSHNLEAAGLIPSISKFAGLKLGSGLADINHNLELTAQLRKERFDLAINCYQVYRQWGVIKLALLLSRIGARKTAGRDTDGKGWCFNQRIRERSSDLLHEVDRQSRFVEQLGCRAVPGPAPLSITIQDQQAADLWLTQQAISPQTAFVAIHPGGSRIGHRWPAASFAQVAASLAAQGLRIVVTGGKSEEALAQSVAGKTGAAVSAAGKLSFGQLAHLLRRSRCFLSNDSGPMHLASALNVPLVAVFGPGDPQRYGPYPLDREDQVVIHAASDALCFNSKCPGHACLQNLSPQPVLEAVQSVIAGKHPSGIQRIL